MPAIGTISAAPNGCYQGYLRTLMLDAPIRLEPISKSCETAADFRILSQGTQIGTAFIHVNPATASQEILLRIEAPELSRPIHAFICLTRKTAQSVPFDIIWQPHGPRR